MRMFLKSAIAVAALALTSVAAQATTTLTVVSFTAAQRNNNMTYTNNGAAGWTLSTVTPKQVLVTLEDPAGGFVSGAKALWSFTGTGTSYAVNTSGNDWSQDFTGGTISFKAVNAITIGAKTIAAGGNILSLTFTGGDLMGTVPGTTGSAQVSIPSGGFVTVSSDFLDIPPVKLTDFSISLSNVIPGFTFGQGGLGTLDGGRFSNFTARASGDFTATVPEPGTWAMLLLGFGLVGFARRRQASAVAA